MKQVLVITIVVIFCMACNNSTESSSAGKEDIPKTHADTLLKEVMEGHDYAMGKMSKLTNAQKKAQAAIDSLNKLPGKLTGTAAGFKTELDSLSEKLKLAENSMDKWMEEFNYDTAVGGSNRTGYLEIENKKVTNIKEIMTAALQKADSLLKK